MSLTLEEQINAYYKAKEGYTELLHKCATDSTLDKNPSDRQDPPPKFDVNWFTQPNPDNVIDARPDLDIATIIEMSKVPRNDENNEGGNEPGPSKAKGKAKGKR